jgi:hypothetical protein
MSQNPNASNSKAIVQPTPIPAAAPGDKPESDFPLDCAAEVVVLGGVVVLARVDVLEEAD